MRNQVWARGILVLILSAGISASVSSAEPALPKEAQEAMAKASGWQSYKASFTLEAKEENGKLFTLKGVLLYRQPGQRRLEIREGDAKENTQVLVSDGKTEWQYYPQSSAVYKINNPPEAPGPHRPFSEVKAETVQFVKRIDGEGGKLLRFEAQPQPASVEGSPIPVKKVQLDVGEKDGMLREMAMLDEKGEPVLTQKFIDVEVNPSLADDQFSFTPPTGVSVMEMPPPGAQLQAAEKQGTVIGAEPAKKD